MTEYLKQAPRSSDQVTDAVRTTVADMLRRIEREGIDAIRHYSRELDGWAPPSFVVDADAIDAAAERIEPELRRHIAFAQEQVRAFATAQRATLTDLEVTTLPGVTLGHRHIPVGTVGAYVPGGRYPMLASSFMTVVVPKVAGVDLVVAAAPPQRDGGGIHPAMLYSMATSGADQVLALGGVQALAALVHGIEGLPPADIVVGAGNAYFAEAKRQLFGEAGIDLLAGPTEIAVIADATADAELVAADLLGQAEHGPTSPAVLITTSRDLGLAVLEQVARLLETWPTREVAGRRGPRTARSPSSPTSTRRSRCATRSRPSTSRCRSTSGCSTSASPSSATTARCSSASRRRSRTATRASAPTTCCRRWAPPATPAASGSASSSRPARTSG
jgi:sulfopropanediol 3-dehydrogenase